ncbi:related to ENA5-Plasma membrane P-type ATPase involved in Na+ and Li+ efflux [Rhynchosporium agropyri]|uniref:Related to ENA5-Plasma membrane P-type ATPase involved in Na+ and Li+ efflux n=1 Tax=Rhynchosporium agropyri TaxID=914238 RepID=A0A1E1LKV0_9HELO|nr:related to ENA5-Plasma membrane P-type ATPase involved in Na+ and Li+ efflux [Rhynchosporium agropyri]
MSITRWILMTLLKARSSLDSEAIPRRSSTLDGKQDFDHQRSAAALKFDVPAEKLAEHQNKTEKVPGEEPATLNADLEAFLLPTALCNLATAHRFDLGKKDLEGKGWKQITEYPFDSTIKRMSVVYKTPDDSKWVVYTKGAVERVIDLCTSVGIGDRAEPMSDAMKDIVLTHMDYFARQGQRVLAVASKVWPVEFKVEKKDGKNGSNVDELRPQAEHDLTLIGLVGIYDPPREETKDAVRECSEAGIKVHMLTGDHPAIAEAIAKEIGIIPRNVNVLPKDVAASIQIDALPELPLVIARCAPDTKTRMIEALHRRGLYMAMTGDGVKDAPSLSSADFGIAMGLPAQISTASYLLSEGRRMFDNIQKLVLHLLTSNVGEVILLIAGLGFQDSSGQSVFPLSPLQILWVNMLTSSFPALGLGREKPSSEIMQRPPHKIKWGY